MLLYKKLLFMTFGTTLVHAPYVGSLPAITVGGCGCWIPRVFSLLPAHSGNMVASSFTRIREFHSSPSTLGFKEQVLT